MSNNSVSEPAQVSRRSMLKTVAKAAVSAIPLTSLSNKAFAIKKSKPTLRVLGTHVTLQEELRAKAMEDLGIELTFEPKGSAAVLQKASTRPESFDLYEQWSNSINVLWRSNAIQPIEKSRIERWRADRRSW